MVDDSGRGVLEGVTVVRVPAAGFEGPIVLGAVRTPVRFLTVRLEAAPDALPPVGTAIELSGSDPQGWVGRPESPDVT